MSVNIIIVLAILILNITFSLWAGVKYGVSGGEGTLFQGKCTTASRITTIAHTVINILSTLLLGASNYAMQVLGSPTREEVDKAHKEGSWVDIVSWYLGANLS